MAGAAATPSRVQHQVERVRHLLLEDGALLLVAEAATADLLRTWLPRSTAQNHFPRHIAPARIDVRACTRRMATLEPPEPCIEMLGLRAWTDKPEHISLRTIDQTIAGSIDLAARQASIRIMVTGRPPEIERDLFWTLTVAAAFLLGRHGRILLHAAGFVAPSGNAWLLVGGTHSGKSSTCANLIRAGWDYLADDQLVVRPGLNGTLWVEGLPRAFRIDDGFAEGTTTGQRSRTDPALLGCGKWVSSAPLGGIFFTRIEPDRRSAVAPLKRTDALQELIRQSPWLLADAGGAPAILSLMLKMVDLPTYALTLGRDSYRDPGRLVEVLKEALDGSRVGRARHNCPDD